MNGARWVQENIVEKYRDTALTTYVVWLPILPSDRRDAWRADLVFGAGVTHYWDGSRLVGKWMTGNVKGCVSLGPVAWDSFYLVDASAEWGESFGPILSCGAPVIVKSDALAAEAGNLLKKDLKVEVLYFEGCPNYEPTVALVNTVARELAIDAEIVAVEVAGTDEAAALGFLGSPTVRVNGVDIEPAARGRSDFGLACRTYGGQGVPPRAWVEDALNR